MADPTPDFIGDVRIIDPIPLPVTGSIVITPTNWLRTAPAAAFTVSRVIKASGGTLRDFTVFRNAGAGPFFVYLLNTPAAPAVGALPDWGPFTIAVGQTVSYDFGESGLILSAGITLALSSSALSFVAPSAQGLFHARFT